MWYGLLQSRLYTLGQVKPKHCPSWGACPLGSPAKRNDQRLAFVLEHSLDERIKCFPCRGMSVDFEIVNQGDQLSDPIHAVQRRIEVRFLAEDWK